MIDKDHRIIVEGVPEEYILIYGLDCGGATRLARRASLKKKHPNTFHVNMSCCCECKRPEEKEEKERSSVADVVGGIQGFGTAPISRIWRRVAGEDGDDYKRSSIQTSSLPLQHKGLNFRNAERI